MDLDPVLLSRFQFAWVIGWHILMPAFTVGMASYIAILEGFHFTTGREVYLRISMFWIRIFSVAFGVGVVSGVIMPFQFGTNWSRFADATSNVLGPLFAYEGIKRRQYGPRKADDGIMFGMIREEAERLLAKRKDYGRSIAA